MYSLPYMYTEKSKVKYKRTFFNDMFLQNTLYKIRIKNKTKNISSGVSGSGSTPLKRRVGGWTWGNVTLTTREGGRASSGRVLLVRWTTSETFWKGVQYFMIPADIIELVKSYRYINIINQSILMLELQPSLLGQIKTKSISFRQTLHLGYIVILTAKEN